MNKGKRVNELYNTIEKANTELREIRNSCDHSEGFEVKMYSERIGSVSPQRLCNICDSILGGLTSEEAIECELKSTTHVDKEQKDKFEKEVRDRYKIN